jgi:hypothetical protein
MLVSANNFYKQQYVVDCGLVISVSCMYFRIKTKKPQNTLKHSFVQIIFCHIYERYVKLSDQNDPSFCIVTYKCGFFLIVLSETGVIGSVEVMYR